MVTETVAPICQSCAIPMRRIEQFGTELDGRVSDDYCIHCYQAGAFIAPDITMDQMSEIVAAMLMAEMQLPDATAQGCAQASLMGLRRWQVY